MANSLYDKGREAFLNGDIDWLNDDIRCILIDSADYAVDTSTHDFLNDIPAAARVAVSSALTGKTSTNGVADANNVVFTGVTGDTIESLVIYRHTGTEGTSHLIAWIDTAGGLPVTPSGGDITIQWSDSASRIFKL